MKLPLWITIDRVAVEPSHRLPFQQAALTSLLVNRDRSLIHFVIVALAWIYKFLILCPPWIEALLRNEATAVSVSGVLQTNLTWSSADCGKLQPCQLLCCCPPQTYLISANRQTSMFSGASLALEVYATA